MRREYIVQQPDPLAVARAFDIPLSDVALRLDVTPDYVRRLARTARHAGRVRRIVLELALQKERLAGVLS